MGRVLTIRGVGAVAIVCCFVGMAVGNAWGELQGELVFPLHSQHNHAPGIVELANGELLVSWYRGSGERTADDVAVWGARKVKGDASWSEPFLMVDTPGFPDGNTALWVDRNQRLWLFWPVVLANTWESCLTHYRSAAEFTGPGAPRWDRHGLVLLKPDDFRDEVLARLDREIGTWYEQLDARGKEEVESWRARLGDKLYQRLGWQPRCKPTELPSGRILLPLYSDTYSMSIMAISDDQGASWRASRPLIGFGNIQPTVLRRDNGTLVAYMRENGPRQCIRVAESRDEGETWENVTNSELPNPGSGLDGLRLANGHWLLIYNDLKEGRNQLAVSISDDEGATWKWTTHLERHAMGSYHYPAVTQGSDGTIHAVYSYFVAEGKSMKHVAFKEQEVASGGR